MIESRGGIVCAIHHGASRDSAAPEADRRAHASRDGQVAIRPRHGIRASTRCPRRRPRCSRFRTSTVRIGPPLTSEAARRRAGSRPKLPATASCTSPRTACSTKRARCTRTWSCRRPPTSSEDDGRLEAWEIMRLRLTADVVVLAACDTGRGRIAPGEGVIGAMWALFVAGARSMVVSQFPVESKSATTMLVAFHRHLAIGRESKAGQLRAAQIDHTTKHPQRRLAQRQQALCPILMPITAGVFLLRVLDRLLLVARQGPGAAGRIRLELTARLPCDVSRLLSRLHRAIFGRLDDDRPLATHPGNKGGPGLVVLAPAGLAFFAAPTWLATQRLLPTPFGLPRVAGGMGEGIRFHRPCQLARHFVRHRGIPQPPAPTRAGAAMDSHLPRDTLRRTGETEQTGREHPVRQRSLALVEQRVGAVGDGALAAVAPVAFAPRSGVGLPPRLDGVTVTPGTLQGAIFPSERLDIGVAGVRGEELVEMGAKGHG